MARKKLGGSGRLPQRRLADWSNGCDERSSGPVSRGFCRQEDSGGLCARGQGIRLRLGLEGSADRVSGGGEQECGRARRGSVLLAVMSASSVGVWVPFGARCSRVAGGRRASIGVRVVGDRAVVEGGRRLECRKGRAAWSGVRAERI
ncbi:uncharacterized protein A4U43_C08F29360 [Asparagus officinalis]|nr:uncharacterized protein A4U43_C08F29360 [Asparagus officinalis]